MLRAKLSIAMVVKAMAWRSTQFHLASAHDVLPLPVGEGSLKGLRDIRFLGQPRSFCLSSSTPSNEAQRQQQQQHSPQRQPMPNLYEEARGVEVIIPKFSKLGFSNPHGALSRLTGAHTLSMQLSFTMRAPMSPFVQGCLSMQTRGMKAAPKQMEVILTADINKVGKAGDIVKVAKGYARNMLIPQLLALPKLDKYVDLVRKQLEALKVDHPEEETVEEVIETKTEEQRLKELTVVLNRLDTQRVVVRRHTPRRSNVLQQHVTPGDLVAEVKRQQKIQLEEINLEMASVLQTLGEYEIPIRLPKSVQIPGGKAKIFLKVKVRRA